MYNEFLSNFLKEKDYLIIMCLKDYQENLYDLYELGVIGLYYVYKVYYSVIDQIDFDAVAFRYINHLITSYVNNKK